MAKTRTSRLPRNGARMLEVSALAGGHSDANVAVFRIAINGSPADPPAGRNQLLSAYLNQPGSSGLMDKNVREITLSDSPYQWVVTYWD